MIISNFQQILLFSMSNYVLRNFCGPLLKFRTAGLSFRRVNGILFGCAAIAVCGERLSQCAVYLPPSLLPAAQWV